MGRLTARTDTGHGYYPYCTDECMKSIGLSEACKYCDIDEKICEKLTAYEDIIDSPEKLKLIDVWYSELCKENGQLMKELAEYKKLEEEKKLIKLPCNVGDTVYYVDDIRKFVDECTVTKVDCRTWNRYHMGISIEMQGKLWHCIGAELIGEVAFHTQEEAEQALERMKGVRM